MEAVALGGAPRELHVLRPDRMSLSPGRAGAPDVYTYAVGGEAVRFVQDGAIPPILHLVLPHPFDDHFGLSPLDAALSAIDIHNAATAWTKALLDNAARPSGALVYSGSDGTLSEDQYERLKAELSAGFSGAANAGRPLLLEGGLDWKPLSLTPKDMDFMEAKRTAAREIALAFGVPPIVLGIPGDATYANFKEANAAFHRDTAIPLARRMWGALTAWLAPGEAIEALPDEDAIGALADDRAALWARVGAADFLSETEKRVAVGYPADKPGAAVEVRYSPDQPRLPAGQTGGGQWTSGGGDTVSGGDGLEGASGRNRAQEIPENQLVDAHTRNRHIGQSNTDLERGIRYETARGLWYTTGRDRNGSFESEGDARRLIREILLQNQSKIDDLAEGRIRGAELLTHRFGFVTGREAILDVQTDRIRIRDTFGVGVVIERDTAVSYGFRIVTAYPRNYNERLGR